MEYTRKHYVEFLVLTTANGFQYSDSVEIAARDTTKAAKMAIPWKGYGFRFFDILFATVIADGEKVELKSECINWSPLYYCGGKVLTVREIRQRFHKDSSVVMGVRGEGHDQRCIYFRDGVWMKYNGDGTDIV